MPDPVHKERPRLLHPTLTRGLSSGFTPGLDYPLQPVSMADVRVDGGFWGARIRTYTERMLPHALKHLSHNIENFRKAAGKAEGSHAGLHWDDSDLYKVMEGAAYALAGTGNEEIGRQLESLVEIVAGAQEPDGYLYTARTTSPLAPAPGAGPFRWSFMPGSHELYCMGHLIEAGVAHYDATGRRSLLNVALLAANGIDAAFGPDGIRDVCGHPEIELALARLYRTSGDPRFLRLSRFFLDERGRHQTRKSYGEPEQDHLPVVEQTVPVGHAVRATYLYAAMTDVAAMMDDPQYVLASEHLWNEVVGKHLAVTGAVGPRHDGEAFGDPYELPTRDVHYETCAAVGMMLWCHRLFLLNSDGRYLDVLERALYNVFLSSHSLDGQSFLYCNPLESVAQPGTPAQRPSWQGCACCPTNVARVIPAVPGWAYASRDRTIYVALFVQGSAVIRLQDFDVRLKLVTAYPWDGEVALTVNPMADAPWNLEVAFRIPGWSTGSPVPSDLYTYEDASAGGVAIEIDGRSCRYRVEKGFAFVTLSGKPGDRRVLTLQLPMSVRRVVPNPAAKDLIGRIALERGPLVYCSEIIGPRNKSARSVLNPMTLQPDYRADLLGGVTVLRSGRDLDDPIAIPYYAWNNRSPSDMMVWLPRKGAEQ